MGNIVTTFVFGGAVEQACSLQKWCHNAEVLRKHLAFQKQIVVRTVVLTNRVPEVSNLCPRADVRGFDPRLTAASRAPVHLGRGGGWAQLVVEAAD